MKTKHLIELLQSLPQESELLIVAKAYAYCLDCESNSIMTFISDVRSDVTIDKLTETLCVIRVSAE